MFRDVAEDLSAMQEYVGHLVGSRVGLNSAKDPVKILLNNSTMEEGSLVFMLLEEPCNSEDVLRAACQLSCFGSNTILGNEQKIRSPN